MGDMGDDAGAALTGFRAALKAAAASGRAGMRRLGLYEVAIAAGRPGLGGFAPVAGGAARAMPRTPRPASGMSEAGLPAGAREAQAGGGVLAAKPAKPEEMAATSCQAVVAQARHEAAAARARRAADAAARHLPVRGVALGGLSFAPPARGGAAGGDNLQPVRQVRDEVPGLRRRSSVHGAVMAAEASAALPEEGLGGAFPAPLAEAPSPAAPLDIERALEDYFFQQSRLPPAGGAGFNPLLSPVWAGLKLPG